MGFSNTKSLALKPQKEKLLSTFLLALLTAAAFIAPYMFLSEGYFTFYGDFNVQQIPFYQNCQEAVKSGNIFWSNTTDLGANFIGSYSFYLLGSPFFWITLLFPTSFVPYLMGPLLILKFGCAAVTSYLYIRRFTRTSDAARLGGLLYAFSGFSVYSIFFNHFHEAIIVFPLLLLSLELLITENRRGGFALTVCLCSLVNYFFFFGMVVFTVIYFFVRLGCGSIKVKFSRFAIMAFEAVSGLLMSAVLLLPSVLAIVGNTRISDILLGWNAIMYGKEQIYANILECFFFPPDIPARPVFFPSANVKWSSLGGWLPLFSTVGLFTFFSKKKGHWIKRLLAISLFMALVPILNSAFYAFNTAYYARWFYMPILIMCLGTVMLTEDPDTDWSFGYNWVFCITVAVSAVIGLFPQKDGENGIILGLFTQGKTDEDKLMYTWRFWGACAIAVVSLIVLKLVLKLIKTNKKAFFNTSVAFVCIITVLYANVFVACGRSHSFDVKDVVIDQLIEGKVDFEDDSEFRIDVFDGVDNTAMFLGYSGINAFHSIVPPSVTEFYKYIGIRRSVASRPDENYPAIRPLLSVKYLLDSKKKENNPFYNENSETEKMPGYRYLKTQNNYYIYENKNYIPYGFSYDYYMSYDFCEEYSEKLRPNLMLKAMLLTDSQIKKYGKLFKNLETSESYTSDYSDYADDSELEKGTTLSTSDEAMEYDCKKLAETSAVSFKSDNKGFTATVKRDRECLVFFSIPYDKGFTATVNGKPCKIEKVNVGFMAVKVGKGTSTVRFNYETPGLVIGALITAGSAIVFLIYIIVCAALSKKRKNVKTVYPEGEELLKEWRSQEISELNLSSDIYVAPTEKKSILDNLPEKSFLPENSEFENGFKIDIDAFKDN